MDQAGAREHHGQREQARALILLEALLWGLCGACTWLTASPGHLGAGAIFGALGAGCGMAAAKLSPGLDKKPPV